MSEEEVVAKAAVVHAGSIPISRSMFEMRPSLLDVAAEALRKAADAALGLRWSDFNVPYIRPEFIEDSEYDGGSWGDGSIEPVPRRRFHDRVSGPVRIVDPHWRAVKLASDEAALLAQAKRCACGHLDVFHNHDGESGGVSCGVGECECYHLRTRLASRE